ncbi:MAG: ribonuclease Z [Deltaproteobacteria bacterium]|nr:ribonuclease Z [Candidatus Tharpella sp.]
MTFPWQIEALNPPFGDPGFILRHIYSGQALLFDLGNLHRLAPRSILKVSHIFISHGHIDHLIGFDHLLRLTLNRSKHLHIYGPPGIIELIGHKLQGYCWNLTAHYELLITVYDIHENTIEQTTFACRRKFQFEPTTTKPREDATIFTAPTFNIAATTLDHGTPCLAFVLKEPLQVKIRPEELDRRGWIPGPWLSQVRQALQSKSPSDTVIEIAGHNYQLQEIAAAIALIKPGLTIAYVTDIGFTQQNRQKLIPLIKNADLLLCEAAFLTSAADKAEASRHLTAAQAGKLASLAQAKRLQLFHFSPRHTDNQEDFYRQAEENFSGPIN